jgi:hypothetical protein
MGQPRRASQLPRSKGHSKSIFPEAIQMSASVNQLKKKEKEKARSPALTEPGSRPRAATPTCGCHRHR